MSRTSGTVASVPRRVVAYAMRDARKRAGKTVTESAAIAGLAQGTLTKYEKAENPFPKAIVYRLADYYGMDSDARDQLVELAGRKALGWWQNNQQIPAWFASYVAFEYEAGLILTFEDGVIPGLLQTPEYARALLGADLRAGTPEEITAQVDVRIQRQARLAAEEPLHLHVVLGEAALHRPGGDAQTMRDQLAILIEWSARDNIDLRVLPFDAGVHTSSETAFTLMRFPSPLQGVKVRDVCYIEYKLGAVYLEEEAATEFSEVHENLRQQALDPAESVHLIQRVMDERYMRSDA
ncbi:helix-turn-helix domain-containing protein [Nocardiopsis synnemataformans]|uniref:helix-turn-helix domain-containing protein n=1 Tax=Nocardiopsis synnemataformans TaxID=61305 RepID=UPI003EBDC1F8